MSWWRHPALVAIAFGGLACEASVSLGPATSDGGEVLDVSGDGTDGEPVDVYVEGYSGELAEGAGSAPNSVVVGIEPTPRTVFDAGSAQSNRADAILMAMASGARGLQASYAWSELWGEAGAEFSAWEELEGLARVAREQKRTLLVSIRTVDATLDVRPAGLKGTSWSEEGGKTQQAMEALLDTLFTRVGSELRYLSIAFEIDRYLEGHADEADDLIRFALQAVGDAKAHPKRPAGLRVGVTWSYRAWLKEPRPSVIAGGLVEASQDVFVTYAPMADQHRAGSPDGVFRDLEILAEAIPERPIVLSSVSYPSSELIGASESAQGRFIKGLFSVVGERRNRFSVVVVRGLHDDEPGKCIERAAAEGYPGSAELYAWWCSAGLLTRDGVAKPSYELFRSAAATFLEP